MFIVLEFIFSGLQTLMFPAIFFRFSFILLFLNRIKSILLYYVNEGPGLALDYIIVRVLLSVDRSSMEELHKISLTSSEVGDLLKMEDTENLSASHICQEKVVYFAVLSSTPRIHRLGRMWYTFDADNCQNIRVLKSPRQMKFDIEFNLFI